MLPDDGVPTTMGETSVMSVAVVSKKIANPNRIGLDPGSRNPQKFNRKMDCRPWARSAHGSGNDEGEVVSARKNNPTRLEFTLVDVAASLPEMSSAFLPQISSKDSDGTVV